MAEAKKDYKVEIRAGAWTVTYAEEAAGSLKFSFEMGLPRDILYFPETSIWREKAPGWAKMRRAEILARIDAAFGRDGCEVVE